MQYMRRPSPGVTLLQYFLISRAQALSSFATLAFSFSRIAFPASVCAEADAIDDIANNDKVTSWVNKRNVMFIGRPLMTDCEPCDLLGVAAAIGIRVEGGSSLIPHCARASVRLEIPRDRLIPTDPSTESGCKAIDRPVPPNRRLA